MGKFHCITIWPEGLLLRISPYLFPNGSSENNIDQDFPCICPNPHDKEHHNSLDVKRAECNP